MASEVDRSLPELVLAPGTTITVTLDDALAVVTTLNVYGFTPARDNVEEYPILSPLLTYGPTA